MITVANSDEPDAPALHSKPEDIMDCVPGIMPLDVPSNDVYWIVGDIFLMKYDVIFDGSNNRIGLIKRTQTNTSAWSQPLLQSHCTA